MQTINPQALIEELKDAVTAGYPAMIWGGPGIGKSDIPNQVAAQMGMNIIDFRANLFDPVDVRGIPYLAQATPESTKYTSWAVPDVFPIAERDGDRGILFIDELPTAPPATQNAFLQLLLNRKLGDYELPVGWAIVCAGNRLTDSAAVYQMPSPVRNRLAHYELEPIIDDWVQWAHTNNINSDVIAFVQYRPGLLSSFDADEYAFPTPRAWSMVSRKLSKANTDNDRLFYGVASLVGDGAAGEFVAFKEIANKLPDIDAIIADPSKYKRDDNPALLYALATAVAARASEDKMANIMKLADKLVVEYQVVLVKGCLARDRDLRQNPDVRKWITKNANVIL
ncbi:MAG: ATPase [Candidatus Marinimicrobia bacterium]|nr:ATPase [Candidatus Neomarinimicrobiota bacterium]|tara:strand:+ start:1849 stop:2865 length:1017 start_codon:yes stop_codon:yes gene_type:complete